MTPIKKIEDEIDILHFKWLKNQIKTKKCRCENWTNVMSLNWKIKIENI